LKKGERDVCQERSEKERNSLLSDWYWFVGEENKRMVAKSIEADYELMNWKSDEELQYWGGEGGGGVIGWLRDKGKKVEIND
jgi:hypothetical protein